jgi:hypothetical protein
MGCTSNSNSPDNITNNFYRGLIIRNITPSEYYNKIKKIYDELSQTSTLADYHENLENSIFQSKFYVKETKDLFDTFLAQFGKNITRPLKGSEEQNMNYALFLISMIFLCKTNADEAYDAVIGIIKDWKIPINGDMISKSTLQLMLKIYISCISFLSVNNIKSLSDCQEEFYSIMIGSFKPNIQEMYIQSVLLTHLKATQIRLYKFFHRDYLDLTYDDLIRAKLISLSNDDTVRIKRKTVNMKPSKITNENFVDVVLSENITNTEI